MDDSFQFIIESPQHTQGHKKRPRLVTSCDNCRLKKIKCLQPSPESKCDACKASKIPCRFRDRERYFAERSRAIAGPNGPSSYSNEEPRDSLHSPDAYSPSGVVIPEGEQNGRYQPYATDSRRSFDSPRLASSSSISHIHAPRDQMAYNQYIPPASGPMMPHSRSHNTRQVHLFDPENPQRPNPVLTLHFIQVFFENLGKDFDFITYEDVATDYWDHRLPPMLANVIAAMAARYSDHPDLVARGVSIVAETYLEMAKSIFNTIGRVPSMDTLQALMLMSWSEYKIGRIPNFRSYAQLAMNMAMDLGLNNLPPITSNDREETRRHATYRGILFLSMTAQQVR